MHRPLRLFVASLAKISGYPHSTTPTQNPVCQQRLQEAISYRNIFLLCGRSFLVHLRQLQQKGWQQFGVHLAGRATHSNRYLSRQFVVQESITAWPCISPNGC